MGHCDLVGHWPNSAVDASIFTIFNSYMYQGPIDIPCKLLTKYTDCSREEIDFVVLAISVTVAILDSQPDPMLQFWDPGFRSCSMWNLRVVFPVLKLFK